MKKSIKGLNYKFLKNIVLSSSLGISVACNNNTVNKNNHDNVKGGSSEDDDEEDTDETVGSKRKGENNKDSELENKKSPAGEKYNIEYEEEEYDREEEEEYSIEEEDYYEEINKYISKCISDGTWVSGALEYLKGMGGTLIENEDKK